MAILIPLAVTFVFCLLRRDLKTWARAVFDWRGLLLFAVIALPWYVFILQKEGWAFVQGFFLKHNVEPLRRAAAGARGQPGVLLSRGADRHAAVHRVARPVLRALRAAWRDDLQCYLLLWFGFVFVFFSLSGTKLPHYILYGMTRDVHSHGGVRPAS